MHQAKIGSTKLCPASSRVIENIRPHKAVSVHPHQPPCVTRSEFSRNGMLESEKIEVLSGYFVCDLHFFVKELSQEGEWW